MCLEEEPSTAKVDSHSAFYRVLPQPESGEIKSAEMVNNYLFGWILTTIQVGSRVVGW